MLRTFESLRGYTLAASDGDIGAVREFYFDDQQWTVRYLVVEAGAWLTGRRVLIIPRVLGEVDVPGGAIAVKLTKDQVRNSPPLDSDKPVARQYEEDLHRHYDWTPHWLVPGATGWGTVARGTMLAPEIGISDGVQRERASATKQQQRGDPNLRSSAELTNRYAIHAEDGEIGRVYDFVIDDDGWRVRYLVIRTGIWFGKDVLLAPDWVDRISFEGAEIFAKLPRSAIKNAPAYDGDASIDRRDEEQLHDHYGRKAYWDSVATSRKG